MTYSNARRVVLDGRDPRSVRHQYEKLALMEGDIDR